EGDTATMAGGSYLVQFSGTATVTVRSRNVDWWVNGADLHSSTLQAGQGYDPHTNTTTATMVVAPGYAGLDMSFTDTHRDPNSSPADHGDGITDLYVMQPSTLGGNTPLPVGTLFTPAALDMVAQYTTLRCVNVTDTNWNLTSDWSDRTHVS